MLRLYPEKWEPYSADDYSASDGKAVFLLTASGYVEQRAKIHISIRNGETIAISFVATGEEGMKDAFEAAIAEMFRLEWRKKWMDEPIEQRASLISKELIGKDWRITSDGMVARQQTMTGKAERVRDFVRKLGPFLNRRRVYGRGRALSTKTGSTLKPDNLTLVNVNNSPEIAMEFAKALAPLILKEVAAAPPPDLQSLDAAAKMKGCGRNAITRALHRGAIEGDRESRRVDTNGPKFIAWKPDASKRRERAETDKTVEAKLGKVAVNRAAVWSCSGCGDNHAGISPPARCTKCGGSQFIR